MNIEQLLTINQELGLTYCLNSEDIYRDILKEFCSQVEEYLPQLELCFKERDWKKYVLLTHALKGNSLNIGAEAFSKLSLKHELAGKENNIDFIMANYSNYMEVLKKLLEKVEGML